MDDAEYEAGMKALLDEFLATLPQRLGLIRSAMRELEQQMSPGALQVVRTEAHKLSGTASLFQLKALALAAHDLEARMKTPAPPDLDELSRLVAALEKHVP
jgi:HPt (histidine-containing phosphotransfer) domain-containing protein